MPSAADYIRRKATIPSDMRTREWDVVDTWTKERAFFMASVTKAEQLQAFRDQVVGIVSGRVSPSQARETMRRYLAESGYQAPAGLEGTIKDLSTPQRLKVSLETTANMAAGWAQRQQMLGDVLNPGQELYRAGQRREPRDWTSRWRAAAESVGWEGVARSGRMIALTISPIWSALSRFGTPYPPFDYGSGMDVMPVDYDTCEAEGLMTDDALRATEEAGGESFNEDVSLEPQISERAIRDSLADQLQGLAEWRDNKLVLTDPNGTRPYDWSEIGKVITTPLPAGIPQMQAEAARNWITDSSRFDDDTLGLDAKEDITRLFGRINPITSADGDRVSRALSFSDRDKFNRMIKGLEESGIYKPLSYKPADSWTANESAIDMYASKKYSVVLRCDEYKSRRRIDGLYNHIVSDKQYEGKPISMEGESVFMGGSRFQIIGKPKIIKQPDGTSRYEYRVREI